MYMRKLVVLASLSMVISTYNNIPARADAPLPEYTEVEALNITGSGIDSIKEDTATAGDIEEQQIPIGEQVVNYASQFIGNPYVYGGTSLTNGADCSGFVMRVFQQFGVNLPRTSKAQGRTGIDVGGLENAIPGDVVSYSGHIGIYMGQNQLVHASNPADGIKVSAATYKPILSVRRMIDYNSIK